MAMPDKLVGRKILCPTCGDPLVIPEADPNRRFKKQDLSEAIQKFQLNDWDRAIARAVYEERLVEKKPLQKAIIETIKAGKRGPEVGLGEMLQRENLLNAGQLKDLRNRLRSSVDSQEMVLTECPNCFASVDRNLRACNYCGQRLGEGESTEICPACKHEQEVGHERCRRCMADMKTGLRPTQQRCHHCHEMIMGNPEVCPSCERPIVSTAARHRKLIKQAEEARKKHMKIAVAAVVVLCLVGWASGVFRLIAVGSRQVALEDRVGAFHEALNENALEEVESFLAPSSKLSVGRDTRGLILTGQALKERVKKVKEFSFDGLTLLEGEKPTATMKCTLSLLVTDKGKGKGKEEVDLRDLFGGTAKTFRVEWRWVELNGQWFFVEAIAQGE
jgi:predicted amidophosphoribosyltransferase